MLIRQIFIAVLVSFLLSLNTAEATPNDGKGYKQSSSWQQGWHKKWSKRWFRKWRNRFQASKVSFKPGTNVANLVTGAQNGMQGYLQGNHPYTSSGSNGGAGSNSGVSGSGGSSGGDQYTKAPEISVASGASTLAFLTGILLLVAERIRTRRI